MAIQTQDAILLKKKDLRETSLLLTFYTRNFGKIHGVLKGARGLKARSNVNPLFFSLDEIVYYEKKNSDFFLISKCETQKTFLNVLKDWDTLRAAYYMLELVDVFTEPGVTSEEIFEALSNSLKLLDLKKEPSSVTRLFEIKILMALGLWPGRESFNLTKGAMSTLSCFEQEEWQVSSKINLNKEVSKEIKGITSKIVLDSLDRPLKTVKMFQ